MKKIIAIITCLVVSLAALIIGVELNRANQRNWEKLNVVFELGDTQVTDVSWHCINNVTDREDGRMELPNQDATYRVEGAFKVPAGFLPAEGSPATLEGIGSLQGIPSTGWLQNEAFQGRILKRKDLPVRLFFSPESGWVVFIID